MTRSALLLLPIILIAGCSRGERTGDEAAGTAAAVPPAASATAAKPHEPPPPLPIPATVRVLEQLPYVTGPSADPRHVLDLYLPREAQRFPTVVFVHGGGYQRGDRGVGRNLGVVLANHGVAVASIGYRLYPQVKHPGHVEDVAAALAWARSAIAAHGGDPARVYVAGHSAGAHLATLVATDGSYLAPHGMKPADLAGVLAISGGYRINPTRREVFGDEAGMAAASPFAHLSGGHPPMLLLYGSLEKQDRHDLSAELRDALVAAGGKARCVAIPDRDHQGLMDQVAEGDPVVTALLEEIGPPAR